MPVNGRAQGFMSRETFSTVLSNIDIPVKEICLYLHGEPFLNRDLDFFIGRIDGLKIMTTIYSNGYNIDAELLRKALKYKRTRFSFSMEIFDKEEYERLRRPARYGRALESLSVIDGIFAENKRKYELTMIDSGGMYDKDDVCQRLFAQYGQLGRISFGTQFPWPEHFYTGDLQGNISRKRRLCQQMDGNVSVYWTGETSICSYDFSGKLIIGDLTENPLSEIYNSKQARDIRRYHFLHRWNRLPLCKNCLLPRFTSRTTSFNRKKHNEKK
jgi:hypothetical protein